jgi:O-methyltransferase involved in polyketide biosynthesis
VSPSAAAIAAPEGEKKAGNLSVTALYTSGTWSWGNLPGAELLASDDARTVFRFTNVALAITRLFKWRLRSLRHSLLHRHTMIDHLADEARAPRILELAAGLSRRGVARTADPEVAYTEVDLAPMVAHKRRLLERTEAGRAALARPNLRLVEGDVTEMDLSALGGDEAPSFVIAEGLFMYLPPERQRALWDKVRSLLGAARTGTFVFDLVPACEEPKPGLAGRALGWLMRRFTGGRGFVRDPRTRHDIASELGEAGFDEVLMVEPATVAAAWKLPFPDVPTQQLLFVARVTGGARPALAAESARDIQPARDSSLRGEGAR